MLGRRVPQQRRGLRHRTPPMARRAVPLEGTGSGRRRYSRTAAPDAEKQRNTADIHPSQHPAAPRQSARGRGLRTSGKICRRHRTSGRLQPPGIHGGASGFGAAAGHDPAPHLRRAVRHGHYARRRPPRARHPGRPAGGAGLRGVPPRGGAQAGMGRVPPTVLPGQIPARAAPTGLMPHVWT